MGLACVKMRLHNETLVYDPNFDATIATYRQLLPKLLLTEGLRNTATVSVAAVLSNSC